MYVPHACAPIVATAFRHGTLRLSFAPYCEDTSQFPLPSPLVAFGTRLLSSWSSGHAAVTSLYSCMNVIVGPVVSLEEAGL